MATIPKWVQKGLETIVFRSTNEAVNTVRVTLLDFGMSGSDVEDVCSIMRTNLETALEQFYGYCVFGDRPKALVYAEIQLIVHCAVIKTCKEHGADKAVDLGYSSMARRNFFRVFAALDTRKWIPFLQGEVLDYMTAFVEDDYVVDPETFCIMDEYNERLFDASSL